MAMITYSRLGAKIWRLVDYFEPAVIRDLRCQDFEDLDREILDWYETVPEEIKVPSLNPEMPSPTGPGYDTRRLQIWTRLRLNQIRIWLHTPVLHSASSIADNMSLAQRVVDLAKETIRYLAWLNNSSNLYRRIQVFYHQFLTSAIAVLFLASTHAPLRFSSHCRKEFYMALELVKDMSARSWVSQRLWRTIRSLKAYAPRLGLQEHDRQHDDQRHHTDQQHRTITNNPHSPANNRPSYSRASSLSSTLAGRPYSNGPPGSGSAGSTPTAQQSGSSEDRNNGVRLQTEMARLFDGYMGLNGGSTMALSPSAQGHGSGVGTPSGSGRVVSPKDGDGVYRHFKDLF